MIPKVYRPIFNHRVISAKKQSTPVIQINGQHYVPIKNQNVKPLIVDGISYIPVHSAPKSLDVKKPIITEDEGYINTFKIGKKTYIPFSVIPKVFRPTFRNLVKPAVNKTQPITTVISING